MTILFLGAGASSAVGYPTMTGLNSELPSRIRGEEHDLLSELLPLFQPADAPQDIEDSLQVIDLIDAIANRRIASVFEKSYVQLSSLAKNRSLTFPKLVALCRSLRDKLQDAIFDVYQFRPEYRSRLGLYTELLTSSNFPPGGFQEYSVFTTNYDRIIEEFCAAKASFELRDGFVHDPRTRRNVWNPRASFDAATLTDRSVVRLFKLHGSLNWKLSKDGIEQVSPEIRLAQPRPMYLRDILIYPGSKERPDQEPFRTLYDRFEAQMKATDRCLVIGYSFRDAYLNRIFRDFIESGRGQLMCMSQNCKRVVAENLLGLKDIDSLASYIDTNRLVTIPAHFGEGSWHNSLRNAVASIPFPIERG